MRFFLAFTAIFTVILLSGSSLAQSQFDLDELVGLGGQPLVIGQDTEIITFCPADELSLPGQGLHASGSTGGLSLEPSLAFTEVQTVGSQILALVSNPTENVAILVVDDFGMNNVTVVDTSINNLTFQGNDITQADIESFQANDQLSHGALVLWHINELIQGSGMGANVLVKSFNIHGFDTTQFAPLLQQEITALAQNHPHIVVNMSFALLPCVLITDFERHRLENPNTNLHDYLVTVCNRNGITPPENCVTGQAQDLLSVILTLPGTIADPLLDLLQIPASDFGVEGLVYVASAGNYSKRSGLVLDFEVFPAALDTVVGVSASEVSSGDPASFSNSGSVMEIGAWYLLNQPDGIKYSGTSYSAPVVTVFSALCAGSPGPLLSSTLKNTNTPLAVIGGGFC